MPLVPKIAGVTSIIGSLCDIHKTALIHSKQEYDRVMGNSVLSCSIGNQKSDFLSCKDAQRKNWNAQNLFFSGLNETIASVEGYFKGISQGISRYLPKFILSAMAIIPKDKGKTLSYISTVALAGVEIWDYMKNGTGMFERTDYLEMK